jgi:dethiobiotin synthetase
MPPERGERPASRPGRLVVVSGTATEVGKTFVGAAVGRALRAGGVRVAARKPVQSFEPGTAEADTDAGVLAGATGVAPDDVCPRHRWLPVPMAPPMAAEVVGAPPFTIAELAAELYWPEGVEVGLVEGVGGPRSPLASDGDTVDLADLLDADHVVLVADAGLGAINAVRVSAAPFGGRPLTVVLNRYDDADDLHRRNREWLAKVDGFDVVCSGEEVAAVLRAQM